MKAFWQHLHRLAHAQLFAHGYLAPRTAVALARRTAPPRPCGGAGRTPRRLAPWPRLAIPH